MQLASRAHKAFTLIELLVVIAIIAILAAILFPVFAQAKKAAKITVSTSNLKQLSLGLNMYSNDYDDVLPSTCHLNASGTANFFNPETYTGILQLMYPYTKSIDIWWTGTNTKPGSLATPMTPATQYGNWGYWALEETILPNANALNVWNGTEYNIDPVSTTQLDGVSGYGVLMPSGGPIAGVSTWDTTTPPTVQVDYQALGDISGCIGSYTNSTVGVGWSSQYAQLVAHGGKMPVGYADGHAGKIGNEMFFVDPTGVCDGFDAGQPYNTFLLNRLQNHFWGVDQQGIAPTN